jgi:5'-nucleotidase
MVGPWNHLRFQTREEDIDYAHQAFINRNLKLRNITHMGFDMDHTLAVYKDAAQDLAFDLTRDLLIHDFGYPEEIKKLRYEDGRVIRGLVVDKRRGNLIKLDQHKYVELAFHGLRSLSKEDRKHQYNKPGESYRPSSDEYAYLDTLFCLPEACLFMQMVSFMDEQKGKKPVDYLHLHRDIRKGIDRVHRDGSLKAAITSNLETYIEKDPTLPKTLFHFIQGRKKLFLLTNSEYYYTDAILSFLLNGEIPGYDNWQDYFEFIVVSSKKPAFFSKEAELERVEVDEKGNEIPSEVCPKVFLGGSFKSLEKQLGAYGESILYFGDHTFGDIMKSKQSCGWRTAMIIVELEAELRVLESHKADKKNLEGLRDDLQEIRDDINMLENQMGYLRNRKLDNYDDLTDTELLEIDEEMKDLREMTAEKESSGTKALQKIKKLETKLSKGYNPYWGCLFKSIRRKSRFGGQVEDFACLYSARLTNFSQYPITKYFRVTADLMAHERF